MRSSPAAVACCLLAAALALAGCREGEQGRVMRYQKGTYLGPTEAPLTNEVRDALRLRARLQGGRAVPPGGGAAVSEPAEIPAARMQGQRQGTGRASAGEAPAALSRATLDALRARTLRQRAD